MPKLEWQKTKDFEHRLFAGGYALAEVFHSAVLRNERERPWVSMCLLPGVDIRKELRFLTEDEAKEAAQSAVEHWFKGVLRDDAE